MFEGTKQQFGNYRLGTLLGQGGFADVYLAEHIYLKTRAAIKILHMRLGGANLNDFINEARTIVRLDHPHIVRVLDFGVEDGIPFLVMIYAPNGTLRQHHPKGTPVPLALVVSYVQQVAQALQYAHNEKFIHRDIKPENMLLSQENDVLLSDFGIALSAQSSRYEHTQDVVGTIAYMAPEQIQGKPRPASDQYALAVIAYEWLSGERPFKGSFSELCAQHMFATPPSLREKAPDVPEAVAEVVMTALEKDFTRRFSSISVFAKALSQASGSTESTASATKTYISTNVDAGMGVPPTLVQTTNSDRNGAWNADASQNSGPDDKRAEGASAITYHATSSPTPLLTPPLHQAQEDPLLSRRNLLTGLVGLAGGLVIGGGGAWLLGNRTPGPAPQPPIVMGSTLYIYHGHANTVYSVDWSSDSKRVVSGAADTFAKDWAATTGYSPVTFYGHSDVVYSVKWSPDGKQVASGSADKTVQIWNAANAGTVITYKEHQVNSTKSATIFGLAWSPDGQRIASAASDDTVHVWDTATAHTHIIFTHHSNAVMTVAWSPNGKWIASAGYDNTVQIWDADTGHIAYTYHGHQAGVRAVAWSPDSKRIASASEDKTVQVWNAMDGAFVTTYHGHFTDFVYTVAWSPDGKHVVSGSGDRTAQIWQADTGNHVYTYHGHYTMLLTVSWSPNGRYIASAGTDSAVHVWQAV